MKQPNHHKLQSGHMPLRSQVVTLKDGAGLTGLRSQFVISNERSGHPDLRCQSGTSSPRAIPSLEDDSYD